MHKGIGLMYIYYFGIIQSIYANKYRFTASLEMVASCIVAYFMGEPSFIQLTAIF